MIISPKMSWYSAVLFSFLFGFLFITHLMSITVSLVIRLDP